MGIISHLHVSHRPRAKIRVSLLQSIASKTGFEIKSIEMFKKGCLARVAGEMKSF